MQVSNPLHNSHSQYYQTINSTDSTFLSYSQFPYSNPTHLHNTNTIPSQTLQFTSYSTEKKNTIVIKNLSAQEIKNSTPKRGKKSKPLKSKSMKNL